MTAHALTGKHLIDGLWVPSSTGVERRAVDPSTGSSLDPAFGESGPREVDRALAAAVRDFPASRDLAPERLAVLLEAIAAAILEIGDPLLERGSAETGLPRARLEGERARTVSQLRLFAECVREGSFLEAVIDTARPERLPIPRPDLRRVMRPVGPVAVFGAGNFPFAFGVAGGDTCSALAAGNPVIAKGHPGHPGTNELVAAAIGSALAACRLPSGLFALLQGGAETGLALVRHPALEAVGFTGSRSAGRALFDLAQARERPIPVHAEMGSINPLVILPGAIAERGDAIAEGLARSITLGVGQFCTKPGAIFIAGNETGGFVAALARRLAAAAPGVLLGAPTMERYSGALARLAETAGVNRVLEGPATGFATVGASLFGTSAERWIEEPRLREEAFGPAVLVVQARDLEELHAALSVAGGNLTATLHFGRGDRLEDAAGLLALLEGLAGRVIANGYPTGVEVSRAMVHGGPYPATTSAGSTSVGTLAIRRFLRPIAFQDVPDPLLREALQDANPLGIPRVVDGEPTRGEAKRG